MGKPLTFFAAKAMASSMALAAASVAHADGPARNPYLANSPNNQSHWNDAATDSTDAPFARGHYCISPGSYHIAYSDALGIPAYGAMVAETQVYWFFSGTTLRKLHHTPEGWVEIARQPVRMKLNNYQALTRAMREEQAATFTKFLAEGDEEGAGEYLTKQPNRLQFGIEDQVAQGVLYSLFTRDHGFIGANSRGLLKIDNIDPADPRSGLTEPLQVTLPQSLFDDEKVAAGTFFPADIVFGLGMTFNGYIVISTLGGTIATVDRETLEIVDTYRAPEPDLFTNGFATSDELDGGAVYIASNKRMYRLAVGADGSISAHEDKGAWAAEYDSGVRLPAGKIADGTGATPTLMGFGEDDDKLVVLTDGAKKMRLVAFWRDGIPEGWRQRHGTASRRIADQIRVDFGPEFDTVQSEQSVVADEGNAFVLNSILSGGERGALPARGGFMRGLLAGITRPLPRGIAMYRWDADNDRWAVRWKRTDIGTIATVPMYSKSSQMVVVNGTAADRPGELFHFGFDVATGETELSIGSGVDPRFNGTFTGIKTDDDGTLMYTTMFGLVRFHTEKMAPNQPGGSCL